MDADAAGYAPASDPGVATLISPMSSQDTTSSTDTTCYRHPDTYAGVVCQRCDRPICTRCMTQASVGFHCPECVSKGSQRVVRGEAAFGNVQPYITMALIAINVLVFVAELGRGNFNGSVWPPAIDGGEYWRLVTGGFLHVNQMHIFMNMFALWNLGRIFEKVLGSRDYVVLYMGSLLAGSLGVVIAGSAARGASGAIFGLIGALVVLYRSRGISIQQSGLMPTLVINALISFIPGISLAGHVGGFLGGVALAGIYFFADDELRKINKNAVTGAAVALSVVFLAAGILLA